jgi:hypothetical protein
VAFLLVFFTLLFGQPAFTLDAEQDAGLQSRMSTYHDEDEFNDVHAAFRQGQNTLATTEDNDVGALSAAQHSLHDLRGLIPSDEDPQIAQRLRLYYNPTILKIRSKMSIRMTVQACIAVLCAFPIFQVFVPAFLGALGEMGVTEEMLSTRAGIPIAAIPVLILGSMAVWNKAGKLFTKVPTDILQNQDTVTDRSHPWYEIFTYSIVNAVMQEAHWGMLWGGIITYLESDLDASWGPYQIYSTMFTFFMLFSIYDMIVRPTNDPDENPFRSYESNEDRIEHQNLTTVINCAKAEVQGGNNEVTNVLAGQLNVLQRQAPATASTPLLVNRDTGSSSSTSVESVAEADAEIGLARERPAPRVHKDTYLQLFDYGIDEYNKQSTLTKRWFTARELFAKWAAAAIQTASIPMREMITYAIPYLFIDYFTSSQVAIAGGVITAIIFTPSNIASAFKEVPLVARELVDIMRLYPPNSPPSWGNIYIIHT